MPVVRAIALISVAALAGLAGCSRDEEPQLFNIREGRAPDEFNFVPNKPIEVPETLDLAALPAPTPGGANRVDPTPEADAIAALGGRPERLQETGIPASDSALVTQASRFGVANDIRPILAAEDLEFRKENRGRFLERVMNVSVYFKAYREQSLNQHAELERWRRAGVRTVGAPPENPNAN
ncbi:DUF3035 domain-containing protein [Actibacterium sp. XHP0104]|uniref:DUF3035 domain-containing protein n=1 Tax=Actibacterium sp. XHP0104 TaxID=2984335 RepID=UPI0021E75930|nr:DUF3035 domain-containing protein [Actibacterium sp. XHP0104]MCV2881921.1 DUF3035 domain-containing protein [Actibacterium sp. XHP0104]